MKSSYWFILILKVTPLLLQSFGRLPSWFLCYIVSEWMVGLTGVPCARHSEAHQQSIQGLGHGMFMPCFCCFCHLENIAQEQAFYTHNSKSTLVRISSFKFHLFTGIIIVTFTLGDWYRKNAVSWPLVHIVCNQNRSLLIYIMWETKGKE